MKESDNDQKNYIKNDSENTQNEVSKIIDSKNNASKENYLTPIDDDIFPENIHLNEYSEQEIENQKNPENKEDIEISVTDSLDETSNSVTNFCNMDFEISSIEDTSNSSWKVTSQEHFTGTDNHEISSPIKNEVDVKAVRNTFPTVFNKKELSCHMNMCSDKDDIVIPIRYFKKCNETTSRLENCTNIVILENSTEYDLDTDKLNASFADYPVTSNSLNSRATVSDKIRSSFKSGYSKKPPNKQTNVSLYAYISDIKGIQESLILNKDRRFSRILVRYNCKASIIQLRNLNRGFPHTLLKIECESKQNLSLLARDTDRIHASWNLRSQLRSVHAH